MSNNPETQEEEDTRRVLVVDDDAALLRTVSRMLQAEGYFVVRASSAVEAIQIFADSRAELVVTDISMPVMNGVDFMKRLRKMDPDLPVVLMTGTPSVETAVEAMDLGATRYLVKPFSKNDLTETVQNGFRARRTAHLHRTALRALEELHPPSDAGLTSRFQSALDQIFMLYQPIISWSDKRIHGYEALVRSAETSLSNPALLFEAAHQLGRLQDLSREIRAQVPVPFAGVDPGLLFFNVHLHDLDDEFLYARDSPLAAMADRVVLEFTENAAVDAVVDVREKTRRLRSLGYAIAVDDLGAGYAGLNSLAEIEPDIVKLDMHLVRNVETSQTRQRLIGAIVRLSEELGFDVVAEGVETLAERDCVIDLGCDLLQGYLFARPAPPFSDVVFSPPSSAFPPPL